MNLSTNFKKIFPKIRSQSEHILWSKAPPKFCLVQSNRPSSEACFYLTSFSAADTEITQTP